MDGSYGGGRSKMNKDKGRRGSIEGFRRGWEGGRGQVEGRGGSRMEE